MANTVVTIACDARASAPKVVAKRLGEVSTEEMSSLSSLDTVQEGFSLRRRSSRSHGCHEISQVSRSAILHFPNDLTLQPSHKRKSEHINLEVSSDVNVVIDASSESSRDPQTLPPTSPIKHQVRVNAEEALKSKSALKRRRGEDKKSLPNTLNVATKLHKQRLSSCRGRKGSYNGGSLVQNLESVPVGSDSPSHSSSWDDSNWQIIEDSNKNPKRSDEIIYSTRRRNRDADYPPPANVPGPSAAAIRMINMPIVGSAQWRIRKRLQSTVFRFNTTTFTSTDFADDDNNYCGDPHSTWQVVYRLVRVRFAAGMFRSAMKLVHSMLQQTYDEAACLLQEIVGDETDDDNHDDKRKALVALRFKLAGLWCVYAHVLVELGEICMQYRNSFRKEVVKADQRSLLQTTSKQSDGPRMKETSCEKARPSPIDFMEGSTEEESQQKESGYDASQVETPLAPAPISPIEEGQLVVADDKPLIPAHLYLALEQMIPCVFEEADRSKCFKERSLGFPGFACKHCNGTERAGRFFPISELSLGTTTQSQTIIKHVLNCPCCPVEILDSMKNATSAVQTKPRYGSRKVFFRTLWYRIRGVPTPPKRTVRLPMAKAPGKKNETISASSSITLGDIRDHAVAVLMVAGACPLVGNHAWVILALSRLVVSGPALDGGALRTAPATIALAISACRDGMDRCQNEERPLRLAPVFDATKSISFLSRVELPDRLRKEPRITPVEMELSFRSVLELPKRIQNMRSSGQPRHIFCDRNCIRALCLELNRLSRMAEHIQEQQCTVQLAPPQPTSQRCLLDKLSLFRATEIVTYPSSSLQLPLAKSAQGSEELWTNVTRPPYPNHYKLGNVCHDVEYACKHCTNGFKSLAELEWHEMEDCVTHLSRNQPQLESLVLWTW
jgi:hypothetical protein